MDSQPLVSVLINNYNYGCFLGDAIDSALSQTFANIEVIVVDDGSTDSSRDVIARYGKRIRAVLKANAGQASAFNAGFSASHGDLICFLDADDIFLPEKVAHVVTAFAEHTKRGWCFDQVRLFQSDTGEHLLDAGTYNYGEWDARTVTLAGHPPYVPTATSGLSFRRTLLTQILPMPEVLGITNDNFLKLGALALSPGWMLPDVLSLQRIHSDNAYTRRTVGKQQVVGRMEVLLGRLLYQKFPVLHRLAENIFAHGMGRLWATGDPQSDIEAEMQSFLYSLRFTARQRVTLRALSWCAVETFRRWS
jgi:glycosyltransferase involved in cell wall biosynthesis